MNKESLKEIANKSREEMRQNALAAAMVLRLIVNQPLLQS
jgi:hypothetical protein